MDYDLTPKQKIFCEEYVIDWNATRAAIKAGYSEKTASEMGYENLKKPHLAQYIEDIQKDLGKLAGVSALMNVLELKKIAFTNITDFKDGWMTEKDFEALEDDTKAALSEIQYQEKSGRDGVERIVKFKLHDKQKAIEQLNKMLGFNAPEKHENTNKNIDIPLSQWVDGNTEGAKDMDNFNPKSEEE